MQMEYRLFQSGDDLRQVSRIYAQSWKSAYRGIAPRTIWMHCPKTDG